MGLRSSGVGRIVIVQMGGVDCGVGGVDSLWGWVGLGGWVGCC